MTTGSLTGPVRYTPWPRPSTPSTPAPARPARPTRRRRPTTSTPRSPPPPTAHRSRRARRPRRARAALLRGAAARLRAAGDEIVATCEAETGLPEARLRGELERTAGQLEAFAAVRRRRRLRRGDHRHARPRRQADPAPRRAPDARPDRARRRVRRLQLPARVQHRRRRHGERAGRRRAGDRQGPPVAPGHERARRPRAVRRGRRRRPAGRARSPTCRPRRWRSRRRWSTRPRSPPSASPAPTPAGRAIADRAAARPEPIPVYAEMGSVNPIVVTEAALARARRTRSPRASPPRWRTSAASCAPSRASCSCPTARRATRSPTTSPRGSTGTEPTVLLNERLRDALREAVGRLEQRAERLGGAPEADGPGLPPPADRLPAPPPRDLARAPELLEEHFGPVVLFLTLRRRATSCWRRSSASRASSPARCTRRTGEDVAAIVGALRARAGRVIFDGFPTGVAVTYGMHHGGPFPATTAPAHTSVGMTAIRALAAARRVPERARGAAPAGAARRQPARHLAPRRRRADARRRSRRRGPAGASASARAAPAPRTRLTYSAPPCSATARTGSQVKPYCARTRGGSSPTVIWLTSSSTGLRCSGTGGRSTMSIASSRACGVTTSSGLA